MLRQIRIFALLSCALVPAVAQAGPIAGPDGVLRYPFGERDEYPLMPPKIGGEFS
jgi:hypothetical protein